MNRKHFLYVSILAKELSFSRASESLGISQPTLSQCIKKIEKNLGVDLFIRKGTEVSITPAGERYLFYSKQMLDIEKKMENELQEIADYKSANISIALSPSKCYTLMPGIVEKFREKYPGINLHVEERLAGELLRGIDNEEYDIGVTPMPQDSSKYDCETVFVEEIVLAIPRSLVIFRELEQKASVIEGLGFPAVDFSLLDNQPFVVMQDWQVMQKQLVDLCSMHGVSIRPVVECTNNLTMITMAQAGVGACLIPSSMVEFSYRMNNDNIAYFSISNERLTRNIVCVSKKNKRLMEPIKYIIKLMKELR